MQASRRFKVSGLDWVHGTLGNVKLSAGQPFRTHLRDKPVRFPSLNRALLVDGWIDSSFCCGARAPNGLWLEPQVFQVVVLVRQER